MQTLFLFLFFLLTTAFSFAQNVDESLLLASLERTTCYGDCPYYEVKVYSNGVVVYNGRKNVEYLGLHEGVLSQKQIRQLLDKAKSVGYTYLENKYPIKGLGIIDFPVCITSVKEGERKKMVYNRNDSPQRLIEYQNFFDELIEEVEWKKVGFQN
jgi:hypothetical protein